jgi:hypothetical protein
LNQTGNTGSVIRHRSGVRIACILISTALLAWRPAEVFAQLNDTYYFTRAELEEDVHDLVDVILESHTDPYGFCTKEEFDATVERTLSELPDSANVAGFAVYVADILNVMRDSHTCLDYSELISYQLANGGNLLPVHLISSEEGVFVELDRDSILPKGSRLVSINGHNADSLWQIAYRYACIEGNAETGRRRVADVIFPVLLGLHVQLDRKAIVDVIPAGKTDIYRHTFRTYDEKRWRARQRVISRSEKEPVRLEYPEAGIAHLRVETFAPDKSGRYQRLIRKAFTDIGKSAPEHLILDIRDNGGGSSAWVEYLYSFLDPAGYNTPHNIIGRNSDLSQSRNHYMRRRWNRFIIGLLYRSNEDVQGMLSIFRAPYGRNDTIFFEEPFVQRKQLVYRGKCHLLMNGLTASAGVDFSNQFLRKKRGLAFGESCFGPSTGTWGNPAHYHLTNTRIPVYIATIRYNYDRSFRYESKPLQPDYTIPVNPNSLAQDEDYPLNFVIDHIRRQSR